MKVPSVNESLARLRSGVSDGSVKGLTVGDVDFIEQVSSAQASRVRKLQTDLDAAKKSNDLVQAQRIGRKIESAQKKMDQLQRGLANVTAGDGLDAAALRRAKAKAKAASETTSFCAKNPKMCVGGGAAAAAGAYYGFTTWRSMEKRKKECLNLCYPDDYDTSRSNPTYKTADATHPTDAGIVYSQLYPEHADRLCTPTNMVKRGTDDCDAFCELVCDYDLDDVVDEMIRAAGDDVQNVAGNVIDRTLRSLLGDQWQMILLAVLVIIIVMITASLIY